MMKFSEKWSQKKKQEQLGLIGGNGRRALHPRMIKHLSGASEPVAGDKDIGDDDRRDQKIEKQKYGVFAEFL